jgi:hypothetical protein
MVERPTRWPTFCRAGIAPRRVLVRHPHHHLPNLGEGASAARRPPRGRRFPGNELPMPAQQGIGGDDRRDIAQAAAAQSVGQRGQPPSLGVGQPNAPTTHLPV